MCHTIEIRVCDIKQWLYSSKIHVYAICSIKVRECGAMCACVQLYMENTGAEFFL